MAKRASDRQGSLLGTKETKRQSVEGSSRLGDYSLGFVGDDSSAQLGASEASQMISKATSRSFDDEATRALDRQSREVGEIAVARMNGTLGEEAIMLAQAMILCALPYSKTEKRAVTRRARLGDGSYLTVTFSAFKGGVDLPYGADRRLLAWLFDKAIKSNSPFISWKSCNDYHREVGITQSGKTNRMLRERFERIKGMVITLQRDGDVATGDRSLLIIEDSYLPKSVTGVELENAGQGTLGDMGDRYGFTLSKRLFDDIRRHRVPLPRMIWRDLNGSNQVLDITYWLFLRCHSAQTDSVIPYSALLEQFDPDEKTYRMRPIAKKAVALVKQVWPEVVLEAGEDGIFVGHTTVPLLPDDPDKKRIRRLR